MKLFVVLLLGGIAGGLGVHFGGLGGAAAVVLESYLLSYAI